MKKRIENWRKLENYPMYSVSDLGRIRNDKSGRILRYGNNGIGYLKVRLKKSPHNYESVYVHRLVWETFNGKIPYGYECDHRNHQRGDNRLSNLRLLNHRHNLLSKEQNEKPSYVEDKGKYLLKTNILGNTYTQTYDNYDDMMIAFRVLRDFKKKFYKRIINKDLQYFNGNEKEEIYDCGLY